ncbi:MAG: cation transporter [Gaiellaceae bacterium]
MTDRRALRTALLLVVLLMAAEIAAGMIGHSLALLADAGHLLTDAAALAFALVASTMAARPAAGRWTFGYSRLEILALRPMGSRSASSRSGSSGPPCTASLTRVTCAAGSFFRTGIEPVTLGLKFPCSTN